MPASPGVGAISHDGEPAAPALESDTGTANDPFVSDPAVGVMAFIPDTPTADDFNLLHGLSFQPDPATSPSTLTSGEAQVLARFGYDPAQAYVTEEDAKFGDVSFERRRLKTLAQEQSQKAYTYVGVPPIDVTKICVDTRDVSQAWHNLILAGAERWNHTMGTSYWTHWTLFTPGVRIIVKNTTPCAPDWYRVHVYRAQLGNLLADANPPDGDMYTYFRIDTETAEPNSINMGGLHLVIHELGHVMGLYHPDKHANADAEHVPGSQVWPYPTVMVSDVAITNVAMTKPSTEDLYTVLMTNSVGCWRQYDPSSTGAASCSINCPCEFGAGDCDNDWECKGQLECNSENNGGRYSLLPSYEACVQASSCPSFDPNNRSSEFCDIGNCPCGVGEGDCDPETAPASSAAEIGGGCGGFLECALDIGAASKLPSDWDICRFPALPGCAADPNNNTSGQCGNLPAGCKCRLGEGDCNTKSDCRGDLVCGKNVGALFGRPSSIDICVMPGLGFATEP